MTYNYSLSKDFFIPEERYSIKKKLKQPHLGPTRLKTNVRDGGKL